MTLENLTKNQREIFDLIESTISNILICGKPGVGKSVLINMLRKYGVKFYHFCAPTGLAALNIDGKTLHSTFRITTAAGVITEDYNVFSNDQLVINYIKSIKYLVIDEISMVRADMFDYLDRYMRFAKGDSALPFGGCQVIAVGDFFQLPPIVKGTKEVKELADNGYTSPFIFSSKVFQNNFKVCMLHEVLRQKGDHKFLEILDAARYGRVHPKQVQELNKNVGVPTDLRIKLASRNDDADKVNQMELQKLEGKVYTFHADKFGDWPADPVPAILELKVGAQVLVKMNKADRPPNMKGQFESKIVNGTLGTVYELPEENDGEDCLSIKIKLEDDSICTIYRKRWERKIKTKVDDKWEEKVVASYEQLPLQLAWSISIHKSQGQSFDKVHIDGNRIFAPGQLYVALSRCRTLKGITLESPLTTSKFWANKDVIFFFETLEQIV